MSRQVSMQYGSSSPVNRTTMEDWELIWENEDPSASFAAQTVSLNLAKFGWVKIEAMWSPSYSTRVQIVESAVPHGSDTLTAFLQYTNLANPADAAGTVYSLSRLCEISQVGINFYGCSRRRLNTTSDSSNSTQNGYLVPQRIWGKTTASTVGGDASFHDSGAGMRLLWTNSDTASAFDAQTIALDLSEYDAVYVFFYQVTSQSNIRSQGFALKGVQTTIRHLTNSGVNIMGVSRTVTPSDTGVTFGAGITFVQGTSGTTTNNTYQIPVYIYGIKFG